MAAASPAVVPAIKSSHGVYQASVLKGRLANAKIRVSYDAAELVKAFPPVITSRAKAVLWEKVNPPGTIYKGRIAFARWKYFDMPPAFPTPIVTKDELLKHAFDYTPIPEEELKSGPVFSWWVNFADESLFFGYGTSLMAQDEMQVAEHPVAASLRERLAKPDEDHPELKASCATPITLSGIERRMAFNSKGLYGTAFGGASDEAITAACKILDPPTLSNIVGMAAPAMGMGKYTKEEIIGILTTAYTAFMACRVESYARYQEDTENKDATVVPRVRIHTGNWGCGAFGGNKVIMAILQMAGARLAGAEVLVYHTMDEESTQAYQTAKKLLDERFYPASESKSTDAPPPSAEAAAPTTPPPPKAVKVIANDLIDWVVSLGLEWGVSDGN